MQNYNITSPKDYAQSKIDSSERRQKDQGSLLTSVVVEKGGKLVGWGISGGGRYNNVQDSSEFAVRNAISLLEECKDSKGALDKSKLHKYYAQAWMPFFYRHLPRLYMRGEVLPDSKRLDSEGLDSKGLKFGGVYSTQHPEDPYGFADFMLNKAGFVNCGQFVNAAGEKRLLLHLPMPLVATFLGKTIPKLLDDEEEEGQDKTTVKKEKETA